MSSTPTGALLSMRRGVQSLIARHAVGFSINFVGTLVLARVLGPRLWGVYGIAFVVQIMAQGVLERGIVSYLVRRPEVPTRRVFGTAVLVQCVSGVAIAAVIVALTGPLVAFFREDRLLPLLFGAALSLPFYAVRAVPLGSLERALRYERVGVIEVLDIVVFNAVAVLGVFGGFGIASLAIATIARAVISTAAAWLLAWLRPGIAASIEIVRDIAAFAIPYTGSNLLGYLNGAAAPLVVGGFVSTREFGVLQLAYGLIAYPQILNTIFGRVALPVYSRMTEDPAALAARVSAATSRLIRYVGVTTLAVAATSPLWVRPLYGPEWSGMQAIMLTIAPAFGIGAALTLVTASLNAVGRTSTVFLVNAAFSVVYWTGALLLVPRFGAIGLPLAYALASSTFLWYLNAHREAVGPLRIASALRTYAASSLVVLVVAALVTSSG